MSVNPWVLSLIKYWLKSVFVPLGRKTPITDSVLKHSELKLSAYLRRTVNLEFRDGLNPLEKILVQKAAQSAASLPSSRGLPSSKNMDGMLIVWIFFRSPPETFSILKWISTRVCATWLWSTYQGFPLMNWNYTDKTPSQSLEDKKEDYSAGRNSLWDRNANMVILSCDSKYHRNMSANGAPFKLITVYWK